MEYVAAIKEPRCTLVMKASGRMGMDRPVLVLSVPVREATERIVVACDTLEILEVVESADTLPAIERGINLACAGSPKYGKSNRC